MTVNFIVGLMLRRSHRDFIAFNHRQSRRLTLPHFVKRGGMKTLLSSLSLSPAQSTHDGRGKEVGAGP